MDGLEEDSMELSNGPPPNEEDSESQSGSSTKDGLLSQENVDWKERMIALEKKVVQQDDEIICLKSALSDCIRRLNAMEANKGGSSNTSSGGRSSHALPSKPAVHTPRRSNNISSTPPRRSTPVSDRAPANKIVPRTTPTSSSGMKKWPSNPATDQHNGSHHSPASSPMRVAHHSPGAWPPPHQMSVSCYDIREVRRSGSLGNLSSKSPSPSSYSSRVREPTFNADEGIVRFYLRGRAISFYTPTSLEEYSIASTPPLPEQKLKLEWAYGYRGRDARCNLYLLPTGEMVYFIAAVVVLYNAEEHTQRHYLGHTDDVKCIAVHPDKITIATGQVAGHDKKEGRLRSSRRELDIYEPTEQWPHIRIWNSVNLQTLKVIGVGDFERAVACVAFSKCDGGTFLAAVDEANEHCISLWDWNKGERGQRITETKSSTEPVLGCEFHPCENNIIVTYGKSQISFWTIDAGTLTRKLGIYEKLEKPKFVTCIAFAENGDVISGDSNGNIYIWGRGTNRITHAMLSAHEGGIFSLCLMKDGTLLSGGKDGRIIAWNPDYSPKNQEVTIDEEFGGVRMLSQGSGGLVLVGTTRNCILQGSLDLKFSPVTQGHEAELWGIACHPNQHQFVTCGYDKNLILWDSLTHSAVWSIQLPDGAHCACMHPSGQVMVVGTVGARWLVVDVTSRDVIYTQSDGNEQLECMQFSPDGSQLAIGSRDNYIYVYQATDDGRKYTRSGRCSGHSSFVTHVDWSVDGQYLQSNSGDYELLFWNATTSRQVTSTSQMRDVEWATNNCTLTFANCGIWPEGADGTDVNACVRSHDSTLMASADDFGKVNLYKYPCNVPKTPGHVYGGHSSHVTNVQFLYDDSRLLSTGGKDMAVLQWEVIA